MARDNRFTLITGGAGFIGTNVARGCLEAGQAVHLLDNLARAGVQRNVAELQRDYPGRVRFTNADVCEQAVVADAVQDANAVYHFAAQVAVTTSLEDPLGDLKTNLLGTVNVLEAVRKAHHRPSVLFTSTNKVYGHLAAVDIEARGRRHEPVSRTLAANGISESQPLEFLSPYGCSKGAADQYVLDYAHSFEIRAAVFRMSCIYGPHQLGSEDQGWVAHFIRQTLKGEAITIYGDGKQVRDLLFVEDLVRAMHSAHANMDSIAGQAFNIGGGPANSTSLLDLLDLIEHLAGQKPLIEWGPERLADQRWFVADTSKAQRHLGWSPKVSVPQGVQRLIDWYQRRPALIGQSAVQVA